MTSGLSGSCHQIIHGHLLRNKSISSQAPPPTPHALKMYEKEIIILFTEHFLKVLVTHDMKNEIEQGQGPFHGTDILVRKDRIHTVKPSGIE